MQNVLSIAKREWRLMPRGPKGEKRPTELRSLTIRAARKPLRVASDYFASSALIAGSKSIAAPLATCGWRSRIGPVRHAGGPPAAFLSARP
jgi:hypothetical protein